MTAAMLKWTFEAAKMSGVHIPCPARHEISNRTMSVETQHEAIVTTESATQILDLSSESWTICAKSVPQLR